MFKKKSLYFILILIFCLGLCGCKKDDSLILFNSEPITKDTVLNNSKEFLAGRRIYYVFITQKPLKNELVRIQILKKDEKTTLAGVKIYWAQDFRLYKDQAYYYNDYIVLREPGMYIMQVFSKDNLEKPLAISDFYVR